jgi:hypothetical protein
MAYQNTLQFHQNFLFGIQYYVPSCAVWSHVTKEQNCSPQSLLSISGSERTCSSTPQENTNPSCPSSEATRKCVIWQLSKFYIVLPRTQSAIYFFFKHTDSKVSCSTSLNQPFLDLPKYFLGRVGIYKPVLLPPPADTSFQNLEWSCCIPVVCFHWLVIKNCVNLQA